MNRDLADLLEAVLYEHPENGPAMDLLLKDIEASGLNEVPRYTPLVAAIKAAINANATSSK